MPRMAWLPTNSSRRRSDPSSSAPKSCGGVKALWGQKSASKDARHPRIAREKLHEKPLEFRWISSGFIKHGWLENANWMKVLYRKITYKRSIFHCHVWLPEGKPIHWQENPRPKESIGLSSSPLEKQEIAIGITGESASSQQSQLSYLLVTCP